MPAKIVIQNVYSRIYGDVPLHIEEAINKELQYKIQNYQQIIEAQAKRGFTTDGVVHLYWPRKGHMFYTGMMSDVLRILDIANFEYEFSDRRIIPERNLIDMKFIPPAWKTERDYQNIIAASMIKAGRGIMQAATGAGKTFITSKIIGSIKSGPFFFFVPSKDLLDQSYDCLSECMNIPIGRIGDGQFDVQQINVATIQTAVKAVNSNNPRFKVEDYKFDENDDWDDQIDESKSKIMDSLIRKSSGIYMDEVHHAASKSCQAIMEAASNAYWRYGGSVGPESYIELKGGCFENGFVGPIEKAFEIASKESIAYDWKEFQVIDLIDVCSRGWSGSGFVWKNCLRILRHSGKQCLLVNAKGTNLLVTPDHSIYKAEPEGKVWITTGIKRKRKTLKFEPKMGGTSSDLLLKGDVLFGDDGANFGMEKESQINMVEFCANHMIDSKVTVCCDVKSLDHNLLCKIANPKTIYNWKKRGGIPIKSFIKIKNKPPIFFLTGNRRTIRIAPQVNLANWAYILGFYLGDGWVENDSKKIGFAVELDRAEFIFEKMKNLEGVAWTVKNRIMSGKSVELKASNIFVAKLLLSVFGNVRCYSKSIPGEWILSWTREHREQLLQGLLDSDGSVCSGPKGRVSYSIHTTSEHLAKSICSLLRSLGLWGSTTTTKKRPGGIVEGRQIMAKHDSYIIKWSKKRPDVKKSGIFEHFDHRSIKFSELSVRRVSKNITPEWIYDLEMSGHPSFTADGILVHNSATPFREDGAEKMIQALFGKVVTKVSASWLIRHGYLVKPYIFNIEMTGMHGLFNSYPSVYEHYIVKNDDLNQLVAKLAIRMRQLGVPTLILVQRYNHGDILKKYLPDVPFIKGKMPRKKRKESIASMRDGTLPCAIATTLADEGLDVERLGCVAVAGGGKSITRVYQRVGRALRTFPGKERAIVFLFSHEATFLKTHGETVARILRKEPEFVIINTTEARVMDDLNNLLCPNTAGIFD